MWVYLSVVNKRQNLYFSFLRRASYFRGYVLPISSINCVWLYHVGIPRSSHWLKQCTYRVQNELTRCSGRHILNLKGLPYCRWLPQVYKKLICATSRVQYLLLWFLWVEISYNLNIIKSSTSVFLLLLTARWEGWNGNRNVAMIILDTKDCSYRPPLRTSLVVWHV